jgi:hypothetical protein
MADAHAHFLGFEHEITPSSAELERPLETRRAVRRAIASHCAELGTPVHFHPQGSFRLLTAVRRDGLDLDDGVLFDRCSFPARPSVGALHAIVFEGLRRAGLAAFAREPCLRVLHPRGIRIDVVIYLESPDRQVHLAHRADGWVPAHSSHLIAWFESPADGKSAVQLRRLIKYYKFWAARAAPHTMASGVALTILAKTLCRYSARDDVALVETMRAVRDHLEAGHGCVRPTPPRGEELLNRELTARQFDQFVTLLRGFVLTGERALQARDLQDSIALWRSLFGPCFGVVGREVTAQDRASLLRRILEDFEGFPLHAADVESAADRGGGHRWTL